MTKNEETLNVNVPNSILNEFRKQATEKFGYKRGHIKQATIEAIEDWINKQKDVNNKY